MFESVNELAILVSALLAVAIGSIWYSPLLFGTLWMRSQGYTLAEGEMSKKGMVIATAKSVIVQSVFFYTLAYIYTHLEMDPTKFFTMMFLILAVLATQMANLIVWEKRSLEYFFIHIGYIAVILFGGMSIIMFWPW